jgi:OOP family OmpA-OmpF porin
MGPVRQPEKAEGKTMKNSTLVTAALTVALTACATQQEAPPPAPAPAAKPAPAPAPAAQPVTATPKPEAKKPAVVNLSSTELFEFNQATLTPDAKKKLDDEVVAKLRSAADVRSIKVNGHADRLGSPQYNQRLSEKRAEAVRAYLISKGLSRDQVQTVGLGNATPLKSCPDQKERKSLIECLAPNRRVVVEIQGTAR